MCVTGAAALRVTQGRTLTRDMLRQDLVWVIPYLSSRPNVEKDVVGLLGYLEAYSAGESSLPCDPGSLWYAA